MNEWPEAIWVSISILMFVGLLYISTTYMDIGKDTQHALYEQKAVADQMKEIRKYHAFDDATVYSQDIVSIILETQGDPFIQIVRGSSTYTYCSRSDVASIYGLSVSQPTNYTAEAVSTILSENHAYNSVLVKSASGEIMGIIFKEV